MNSSIIQGKGNSIYKNRMYLEYKKKYLEYREVSQYLEEFWSAKKPDGKCDCHKPQPKPPKSNEVILACGREVSMIREDNVTNGFNNQLPKVLARVSIDTSSLCKPIVKIDFSTLIEIRVLGIPTINGIILRFRLNKTCNGESYALKTYEFKRIFRPGTGVFLTNETKDSFSFTFCDDEFSCQKGCCIYTVELFEIEVFAGPVEGLVISDSAINAIAQGICD